MKTFAQFLGCLTIVAVTGCKTDGGGVTQPPANNTDDGTFTHLTFKSSGGMPLAPPGTAECLDGTHEDVIHVNNTTKTLGWNVCGAMQGVETGERALTSAELASLHTALSTVVIGNRGDCGADKPQVTLDLDVGLSSERRYADDFYSCRPDPTGRTYVENMDAVHSALLKLLPPPPVRVAYPGGNFTHLTLHSTGGMGGAPEAGDPECVALTHDDVIQVDATSETLDWNRCGTAKTVETGHRLLSVEEFESVRSALSAVVIGSSGGLMMDAPMVTLDLKLDTSVSLYADDSNSSVPPPAGRTYVENLGALNTVLLTLVTK